MYRQNKMQPTSIRINKSYEGESIEQKVNRVVNNKEPISDGAPLIYTERKEGISPDMDIRTDRWEAAVIAMNVVDKGNKAKRMERHTPKKEEPKKDGGAEPVDGTGDKK